MFRTTIVILSEDDNSLIGAIETIRQKVRAKVREGQFNVPGAAIKYETNGKEEDNAGDRNQAIQANGTANKKRM